MAGALRRAFAETADPAAYVPRDETVAVLRAAEDWVRSARSESSVAAIVGAPGLGKTFLLRVIETRAAELGTTLVLYLPYAGLEIVDLAIWVYGLLGRSAPAADDEAGALEALCALGSADQPFLLLVDDADSMPAETLQALTRGLPRADSPVRLLLALGADSRGARLLATFHVQGPVEMRLTGKLTVDEVADYLDARMTWAGVAPVERARVDADLVHRFHSLSGGVPRQLQMVAAAYFDGSGGDDSLATLEAKHRREHWMGRPIDDELEV